MKTSPFTASFGRVGIAAPALLALLLFFGCAASTPRLEEAPLSEEAKDMYYVLLLEDAKRTQNATLGEVALKGLLKKDPTPRVYFEAASFYWQQGKPDETRRIVEEAVGKFPDSVELYLMLSQVHLAEKKPDLAAKALEEFAKRRPGDNLAKQELAKLHLQNQDFAKAKERIEAVPEKDRSSVMRFILAKALIGLNEKAKAAQLLRQIIQKDPKLLEAWAELAYLQELDKEFGRAETTYQGLLKQGERGHELFLRLIEINLKLKKPDRALSLVQQGPNELAFDVSAATQFLERGYYKEAEKIINDFKAKKPDAVELNFYLAVIEYEGRKNQAKAQEYLEKIPESSRFHDRALRFRIQMLIEGKNLDTALELAEKGRTLYGKEKDFHLIAAKILLDARRYPKAEDVLRDAAARFPNDVEVRFNLAAALDKNGKRSQGLAVMEEIVKTDPDNADALNYIGYTLAEEGKDLPRARQLIEKALKIKPDNGYIVDSLAWVLFKQGETKRAFEEIKRAVSLVKDDPTIWDHYGDIALALGLKDEAKQAFRKALELNPEAPDKIRRKLESIAP